MQKLKKQTLFLISSLVLSYIVRLGECKSKGLEAHNKKEIRNISSHISNGDEFLALQQKWKNLLVSDNYDEKNYALALYVKNLNKEAKDIYRTLDKSLHRKRLWPANPTDTPSSDLATQFIKLRKLALAYGTKGTDYYKNAEILESIKNSLDYLVEEKHYNGIQYYGNWWNFQIGVPIQFIAIMMVLYHELTVSNIQKYSKAISGYVPNPYKQLSGNRNEMKFSNLYFLRGVNTTAANRADLAKIVLGLGILQGNHEKINQAFNSIMELFQLVTKGDGFYEDGSFIQHKIVPETGAYGNVLVGTISHMMAVSEGSKYEVNPTTVRTFVKLIEKAFIPLTYKGQMLPSVNGRGITRAPESDTKGYGSNALYNLLLLSKVSPAGCQKELKEAVKYWMLDNPNYYIVNSRDYKDLSLTLTLLNDTSIKGDRMPFIGTKMYAHMDRFVQRTTSYMVNLALYSKRISAYEAGNYENVRGWHLADGMMYLYNDDEVQFNETYWPTVDLYRLPGTTVDTVPLQDETSWFIPHMSKESWVGGVSNNNQAAVGMFLNKRGYKNNGKQPMNLCGQKSWFFVDGFVVMLGAGIIGDTKHTIETVVENRLLNDKYNYTFLSNNGEITKHSETIRAPEWVLLRADHDHASIGYYFIQRKDIKFIKEQRKGRYVDIDKGSSNSKTYTGTYAKFLIDHGKHPKGDSYAYAILPGGSESGLKDFGKKERVHLIMNTIDIQAVELPNHNFLGINVWKKTGAEVAGIYASGPVSLLKQIEHKKIIYTISDPTQLGRKTTIKVPSDFIQVVDVSDRVMCEADGSFTIDFTNAGGDAQTIIVRTR